MVVVGGGKTIPGEGGVPDENQHSKPAGSKMLSDLFMILFYRKTAKMGMVRRTRSIWSSRSVGLQLALKRPACILCASLGTGYWFWGGGR